MASLEISILIDRPVEKVFAFVTDLDTWPDWQTDLVEVKKTSPGPLAAGSTFTVVTLVRGREQEVEYTVTEFDPGNQISVRSPGNFTIENQTIFIKADEITRIRRLTKLSSSGLYKILEPLVARWIKNQVESSYQKLKELLEEPAD